MRLCAAFVAAALAATSAVALNAPAQAASGALGEPCADVEVVMARGSGQVVGDSEELKVFRDDLKSDLAGVASIHNYELGSESQQGYSYPAVNVSQFMNGNMLGAKFSGGEAFDYGESVQQGIHELSRYVFERAFDCPDARFVLAGYSQGAQVMGQGLASLELNMDQIDFVALFGDPKLYLPEGEGWRPAACRGKEYSPWRRVIGDCRTDNGSLGARKPYLSAGFVNKVGLWCNNDDFVCGSSKWGKTSGHMRYGESGNGAELGAAEAAERVGDSLGGSAVDQIQWNIGRGRGKNLDVVFVLDTTGSMSSQIYASRRFASQLADAIKSAHGRVALVTYKDVHDTYTARIDAPLDDDLTDFRAALGRQYASGGGDEPEALLHALNVAFDGLDWKDGATKAAIVLSDASWHDPDLVDGSTTESVALRSLEIDPVNVYPVVPSYMASRYERLAQATSGKVIVDGGDTVAALLDALGQITTRPVVQLRNGTYEAGVGEEITFDASDSYGVGAPIATYEWDFDGDGIFEAQTNSSSVEHAYSAPFTGAMQVRATATDGGVGSHSVPVIIGAEPATLLPAPTVTASKAGADSEVTLSWTGNAPGGWVVAIDDVVLGATTDNPVTVTDIPGDRDVTFSITPIDADGTLGQTGTTTLPAAGASAAATLYTTGDLTLTNALTVAGTDGSVATGGNFTCNSSVTIAGDVTAAGSAYLTNGCTVGGTVWAGGNVHMDSNAQVAGSVNAVGDITVLSTNRIGGDLRAAGTVTAGDGQTDEQLHAAGTVAGTIQRGSLVTAPDANASAGASPDDALAGGATLTWSGWQQQLQAVNGAPSWARPGCVMAAGPWSVNGADVQVSNPEVIDATASSSGCATVSLQDMRIHLSADLTIVTGGLSTVGTFSVDSADGQPHQLRIVSQATGAGIDLAAGAGVDPLIAVDLQAAGTVALHNGADLRARVRAAEFRSDGALTLRIV